MKVRSITLVPALLAALCAADHCQPLAAQNTTDPMGFVSVGVPAHSDAVLGVPLYRAPVFRGSIQSISGNVITLTSSPNWTDGKWVQTIPSQNETFVVLIATGDPTTGKEGMIAQITANSANTLTVELADGASFVGVKTEALNPGAADLIDIMPCWTPASLLGAKLAGGTQLMLFPTDQSGINIGSQTTLVMGSGSWLNSTENADYFPLFFGQGFVLRNTADTAQTVVMVGAVPMATHRAVLKKNSAAGTAQDIRIGYASPVAEALGKVHLGFTEGDQLLVFDNTATGINKSSVATLVYNGGAWFKGAENVSASFQLQPGQGYIFRRARTVPAGNATWVSMQSYLQ